MNKTTSRETMKKAMSRRMIALLIALMMAMMMGAGIAENAAALEAVGSAENATAVEATGTEENTSAAAAQTYEWPQNYAYDFSDRSFALSVEAGQTGTEPKASGYKSDTGYEDSTIRVTITTGRKFDCDYWVADITVQDPSQLRTMAAGRDRDFASNSTEEAMGLAKKSKAVVAINGDYYTDNSRKGFGFVIRQGKLYLNNLDVPGKKTSRLADVLLIDEDGDFHGLHQPGQNEIPQLINGKRILNAFTFGPILVEDGKLVEDFKGSDRWMDMAQGTLKQRICIAQAGPLHYKAICCSGPSYGQPGMYLKDFAQVVAEEGVQIAYNLDGGDSTMIYFHGDKVNGSRRNTLRKLHDIIYFASAEGAD